ncbi:SAM-dependent methyltransferase, partial [bacterium]
RNILELLIRLKKEGRNIAAYGAPAKGSILLNYCGIREDFLDYAVDRNPVKQGLFIPGTRVPIFPPERVFETRPDYLLLLPWNLEGEIRRQMDGVREWGGQFIVPIPKPRILP